MTAFLQDQILFSTRLALRKANRGFNSAKERTRPIFITVELIKEVIRLPRRWIPMSYVDFLWIAVA